uniref:Uncharacterized protein n=1 Tax=Daphnia galeata TaxID=27404 RepID=A0A8J2S3V5_9CRUS|nr:unnamed protein product [Daphnia galeata]
MFPRGKDSRPGMAVFFNLLAVFRGEKLNEGQIQQLVHDARKRLAIEFGATCRDDELPDYRLAPVATATPRQENDDITLKQYVVILQALFWTDWTASVHHLLVLFPNSMLFSFSKQQK